MAKIALQAALSSPELGKAAAPRHQTGAPGFAEVKKSVEKPDWLSVVSGGNLHQNLSQVKLELQKGKAFSARELLLFQMQASELNLRVELLAKTADSALASVRRMQSGQ